MPNITYVNLDLLSVGFAVAAIAILGFVIFFNNRESITSKYFLLFCLSAVAWSSVNYISYRPYNATTALWIVRAVMFFGVWLVFFLYSLLYVFPETKKHFTKKYKNVILPGAIFTSILALTPFVFSKIEKFSDTGIPERISIGVGIPLYGIYILSIVWDSDYISITTILQFYFACIFFDSPIRTNGRIIFPSLYCFYCICNF
jgi:hypothetical protein